MKDFTANSHRQTSNIRDCQCACGAQRVTVPGTQCSCGDIFKASGESGLMRKAFGPEDTDLRKGGLR